MATKYYCDMCGTELYWITNSLGEHSGNTDGYKTYDPSTGRWFDLCNTCKTRKLQDQAFTDLDWMAKEGPVTFADGSVGVITKIN